MTTTVKLKRSETGSSVPTTSDIVVGEVALNTADQKIYVRDSSDNIKIVGVGANATASVKGVASFSSSNFTVSSGAVSLNADQSGTITGVGTISTGVWNGTAIGSQYGGTGQNFSSSTGVTYFDSGTASVVSMATKGQLLVGDGSGAPQALSVGTNDYVLTADSTTGTGLAWKEAASGGGGLSDIVNDTTPQLGGNLDLNSNNITGTGNISTTGTLSLTNTTTGDSLLITTTEDSSSAAPVITLKRNSSSPADADYIGQLKFKGENDADQEVVYAKITGKISDASDTTEDGLIEFALRKAGSNNIGVRLTSTELKLINGTGLEVGGYTFPSADGSASQVLQTNGSGSLSFATITTDLVGDTSPQLGGDLDTQTNTIDLSANTASLKLNKGTTAQRDGSPSSGMLRFNTEESSFEGYDGSAWGAIGGGGGGANAKSMFFFTATSGQTTFSGSDDDTNTLSYTAGVINTNIYLNGVLLDDSDYTATNGTSVVLSVAAAADDILTVEAFDNVSLGALTLVDDLSPQLGGTLDANGNTVDMDGNELILDADGDTSITSDTDDQIDIRIGGADDFAFKANKFEVQTGSNIDMNGTELILDADADTSITADTDDQIDFKAGNSDVLSITSTALIPATNDAYDLGSNSKVFRDIYTGDLNLNNTHTRKNEVDGTSGSWTIQEGSTDLFLINRNNGEKYKFKLVPLHKTWKKSCLNLLSKLNFLRGI